MYHRKNAFSQSDVKKTILEKHQNVMMPLINSLQNAFFGLQSVKNIPIVHVKMPHLTRQVCRTTWGRMCVFVLFFYTVVTERKALCTLAPSGALVP